MTNSRRSIVASSAIIFAFNALCSVAYAESDICTLLINKEKTATPMEPTEIVNALKDLGKQPYRISNTSADAGATVPYKTAAIIKAYANFQHTDIEMTNTDAVKNAIVSLGRLSGDSLTAFLAHLQHNADLIKICAPRTRTTCELHPSGSQMRLSIHLPSRTMVPSIFNTKANGLVGNLKGRPLSVPNENNFFLTVTTPTTSGCSIEIQFLADSTQKVPDPDLSCVAECPAPASVQGPPASDEDRRYKIIPHDQRALTYSDLISAINQYDTFPIVIKSIETEKFIAVKGEWFNRIFIDSLKARKRETDNVFQEFIFHGLGNRKFSLKSNGRYLSCRQDDISRLVANGKKEDLWEILTLVDLAGSDRSVISFESHLQRYVGLAASDHNAMHCDLDPGSNTRFHFFRIPRTQSH